MAEQINSNNISQPGGLSTDTTVQQQPKGTSRFALNITSATTRGDRQTRSNEEGNKEAYSIPVGFLPIGKEYMGNGRTALLLVNKDETVSEIGIGYDTGKYETHVNDSLSDNKLDFKLSKQIDVIYNLRRGCEDTIYFTDNNSEPRIYNFSKPYKFKDDNGLWDASKFSLVKYASEIPYFEEIELLNSGGFLEAGSIMVAIQFLDEDFNPTEWILDSKPVFIYNDMTTKPFLEINGSINLAEEALDYPTTSKAIKVTVGNLDDNFPYYRLAFSEASSGIGTINKVKFTQPLSTSQTNFTFTGNNFEQEGTTEEIMFFNERIYKARHIAQVDNTLILGDTEGSQTDFCKLQKYASIITADCVVEKVILNNIQDPRSPKNPTFLMGDMVKGGGGYMPGEIYSFGIKYVFDDGEISPVFHIPGKSNILPENHVFSPTADKRVYPMSIDNMSETNYYRESQGCADTSYWGLDSQNRPINNTRVRHHRFPFRSDINVPLVSEANSTGPNSTELFKVQVNASGSIEVPCTQEMIDAGECSVLKVANEFVTIIYFTVDGIEHSVSIYVNPAEWIGMETNVRIENSSNYYPSENIVITSIIEDGIDITTEGSNKGLTYTTTIEDIVYTSETKLYESNILGIKFSNIVLPSEQEIGKKVVGYFIVRNERVESEKTILDSAVLTSSLINKKYVSHGLLGPEVTQDRISKDTYGIIHPEHKFKGKEYVVFDSLKQEGKYTITDRKRSNIRYDDVLDGTSYNKEYHKDGNPDGQPVDHSPSGRGMDGWSWQCIVRDNIVTYSSSTGSVSIDFIDVQEVFYLNALDTREIKNGSTSVYNISADNKIGFITLKNENFTFDSDELPYFVFIRKNSDSYSSFRTLPYFNESLRMNTTDTVEIFNGDVTVSSMRYTNMVFWENRVAKRAGRTSAWKYIAGIALVIVGAVLAFFTGGASLIVVGAGIALIGAGALYVASGIKMDAVVKAYEEEYDKGLRETALDSFVESYYRRADGPSDDEIQWITDSITDLFFESQINMYLRVKLNSNLPSYLSSPGKIETGNYVIQNTWEYFGLHWVPSDPKYAVSDLEKHSVLKLLAFSPDRDDTKQYLGIPLGEYYKVNPDYEILSKQKPYFHLAAEYDCCSDCKESFRQRIHYSLQSFDEELSDNFRVFLPNNYRDITGSTGPINNLFVLNNDLFIHTRDALYKMPRSYQERVTDQIVSFIGTGSMFEIPPIKMVDDDSGNSAGTQHKWGGVKTPSGYIFPCENQGKIFLFNGQQIKPISERGMDNWFLENTKVNFDFEYQKALGVEYPYKDNVSNPFGTGFISIYDSKNKRVIITKKDYTLNTEALTTGEDIDFVVVGDELYTFPNKEEVIAQERRAGWDYLGYELIEEVKEESPKERVALPTKKIPALKFGKFDLEVYITKFIEGQVSTNIFETKKSWTISYDLQEDYWISYHSYNPIFYVSTPNKFYSFDNSTSYMWEHNIEGIYQTFYGTLHPSIIEYVSNKNALGDRIFEGIKLYAEANVYDVETGEFYVDRKIFFNKLMAYNSYQNTGELTIEPKTYADSSTWLLNQVKRDSFDVVKASFKEGFWNINELRNFRENYNRPMFSKASFSPSSKVYLDKILNEDVINKEKSWSQLEPLRDKHLVVRLVFDKFANVKLLTNFSIENETQSFR